MRDGEFDTQKESQGMATQGSRQRVWMRKFTPVQHCLSSRFHNHVICGEICLFSVGASSEVFLVRVSQSINQTVLRVPPELALCLREKSLWALDIGAYPLIDPQPAHKFKYKYSSHS